MIKAWKNLWSEFKQSWGFGLLFLLLVSAHSYFMKIDTSLSIVIMTISFITSVLLFLTAVYLRSKSRVDDL